MNPTTTFAGKTNPFTGERVKARPSRSRKTDAVILTSSLEIRSDPVPPTRPSIGFKYEPVFSKLRPGQCVRCKTSEVGTVSGSLKKYLKMKNKPGMVKATTRYVDPTNGEEDKGYGRVWLLAVALKAAA